MSAFNSRLTKLEETSRLRNGVHRVPGVSEEMMAEIRRVAAVCGTAHELAAFLATLLPDEERAVVSIEDRQRREAVLAVAARSIMEEVNADTELRAG